MGKTVDVSGIPFKIQLEVKTDTASASRALKGLSWHTSAGFTDCSHKKDGGAQHFVRVKSPQLTLAGGGLQEVEQVVKRLRNEGARTGDTGALRIYVPEDVLDREGAQNLLEMHLASEDVLYRLAMGGGKGRAVKHKETYAYPLSKHASQIRAKAFNPTCDYHLGLNTISEHGNWEFRYFDSSLNPTVIEADVRLILGMVKAAAEGRGNWRETHTVNEFNRPVKRERWNAFLDTVVGDDPVRAQLETQFRASGGHFEGESFRGLLTWAKRCWLRISGR